MQSSHTLLVGIPTSTVWSIAQVVSHESATFIVSLTVRSEGSEPSEMGKRYVEELLTWFDSHPTFETAVDFFSHYVLPQECSSACAFIENEKALFYVIGQARVTLLRAGSYLPLIEAVPQPQCIKGTLFPNDVLFVGTTAFFQAFETQLKDAPNPVTAAQKLLSQTQTHELADSSGCVFAFGVTEVPVSVPKVEPVREMQHYVPKEQLEIHPKVAPRTGLVARRKRVFLWLSLSPSRRKIAKLLFLVFCIVAILFGLQRFILYRREARIQSATAPLQSRYEQITQKTTASRIEKEQLLSDLLNDITEASKTFQSDPATQSKLFVLKKQVQELFQQVSKQTQLEHLSVFYDFRLVTADFVASQVAYDVPGKLAVFLDTNRNRMVSLSLEKKQPQTLSLTSDVGTTQSLTIVDRKAYVLGTKGVYEVSLPLDTAGKNIISASSEWKEPKLLGSFADNLYVVDREARQIFRYDRMDPSASPSAWLRRKEGIDFGSINSLAIDGDVYLSTTQGKVNKLTRGEPVGFGLSDMRTLPDSSVVMYTQEESSYLYFLEPRAKRIIVTTKAGQYVLSITSPDLETATGLIVDEEGKKIYVLAGSLVYEVSFIIPS